MPQPQPIPLWMLVAAAAAIWLSLAVWSAITFRWRHGLPIVPYQPRRLVPWGGVELGILLATQVLLVAAAEGLVKPRLGPEVTTEPAVYNVERPNTAHVIAKLVGSGNPWILALCGLSAIVVVPITEELLFRVVFQGWLEAIEKRLQRKMPTLRRLVPRATGPILLSSALFATMHFRIEGPPRHLNYYLYQVGVTIGVSLAMVAVTVALMRYGAGATAEDLGWVPRKAPADVRLGLVAFAGLAAPIYAVQGTLGAALPERVAPDPIVLFFFAIALGILYHRTHRIVPIIALHMALNGTSLAMALLFMALRRA